MSERLQNLLSEADDIRLMLGELPRISLERQLALAQSIQRGLACKKLVEAGEAISADEQAAIAAAEKARTQLVESAYPYVLGVAREVKAKFDKLSYLGLWDYFSVGVGVLWVATGRYLPDKGVAFLSFAANYIEGRMRRAAINSLLLSGCGEVAYGKIFYPENVAGSTIKLTSKLTSGKINLVQARHPVFIDDTKGRDGGVSIVERMEGQEDTLREVSCRELVGKVMDLVREYVENGGKEVEVRIWRMRYIEGLSYREIAQIVDKGREKGPRTRERMEQLANKVTQMLSDKLGIEPRSGQLHSDWLFG